MRTTFLIALLPICLSTGIATAQHKQGFKSNPAERAQKSTAWMKIELQLSDDQERLAHAVNLKYAKLNQALADEPGSRYTKQKRLKANMEAKDSEMKQILSAACSTIDTSHLRPKNKRTRIENEQVFGDNYKGSGDAVCTLLLLAGGAWAGQT